MKEKVIGSVFPGQGSQRNGMGKDFYENIDISRKTYEEASDALGWDVSKMCFDDDKRLHLTEYSQPCILTTEIAMFKGLEELYGFKPEYFGGHSLGEYAALVAAGVLPLAETLKVTQIRGQLMQKAVPVGEGSMAAVICENLDTALLGSALKDLPVDVANINSSNQVVISGRSTAIPKAEDRIRSLIETDKAFRFVPLNVSAPFHSRFMSSIKDTFKGALDSISQVIKPERAAAVTSNVSGYFHSANVGEIIDRMVSQLSGTVQWKKNMHAMAARADVVFEIGPGRPLRDFFKTIGVSCSSITTLSSARRALSPVGTSR